MYHSDYTIHTMGNVNPNYPYRNLVKDVEDRVLNGATSSDGSYTAFRHLERPSPIVLREFGSRLRSFTT